MTEKNNGLKPNNPDIIICPILSISSVLAEQKEPDREITLPNGKKMVVAGERRLNIIKDVTPCVLGTCLAHTGEKEMPEDVKGDSEKTKEYLRENCLLFNIIVKLLSKQ